MDRMPVIGAVTLLALAAPQPAAAQGAADADALAACAAETDDARRLACFDEAMRPEAAPADEPAPEPAAAPSPAPAAPVTEAAPAVEVAAASATAAAATSTTAAAADEEDDFGKTGPDEDELKEIRSTVVEVKKAPGGEHIVTLENGQVWVEKDAEYGFRIEVGDTAVIKKGTFGGYKLLGQRRRSSAVRRVE